MQEFAPEAFEEIFNAPEKPLIVGGQAVNIWANYYKNDSDELESLAPFTSKDADIVTTPAIARALAKSKGWELCIFEDTRQTMVGILSKTTPAGELRIDVLRSVLGMTSSDFNKAELFDFLPGKQWKIPTPIVLLRAKITNLVQLKNKKNDGSPRNDVRQAHALIPVCRHYLHDVADAVRKIGGKAERPLINELHDLLEIIRGTDAKTAGAEFDLCFEDALPLDIDTAGLPNWRSFTNILSAGYNMYPKINYKK